MSRYPGMHAPISDTIDRITRTVYGRNLPERVLYLRVRVPGSWYHSRLHSYLVHVRYNVIDDWGTYRSTIVYIATRY